MVIGALASLASACLWAITNMLVKLEAHRLSVVAINAYRTTVGAALMLVIFLVSGDPARLTTASLPALAALLVSVIVGLVFGDTLNFRAMLLIGLARSFPISGSFPLFTLALAALFLQEPVGWREVLGCLVTLAGVMLVALPSAKDGRLAVDRRTNLVGVGLALAAAVLWAASSTIVKVGLTSIDAVAANAIRLPVAAVVLLVMVSRGAPQPPLWRLRGRTLAVVVATGLLGSGLSGFLWMYGVQEIGAARAAILSSTSPIFAAPLSVLFLKERLTPRILAGTLLSVAGIALILSPAVL
jgi:drug/metabolite transporter (DMT)-like permease